MNHRPIPRPLAVPEGRCHQFLWRCAMNYRKAVLTMAAIPLLAMSAAAGHRDDRPERHFQAKLRGRNEGPFTLPPRRRAPAVKSGDRSSRPEADGSDVFATGLLD